MPSALRWRMASADDAACLGAMNLQLIQDERHRNPMSADELAQRMRGWLSGDYEAVIFENDAGVVAYALHHPQDDFIYLRQFFVDRAMRRRGVGREAVGILREEVWPRDRRIVVTALTHNETAITFWRAVGFADYCLSLEILPKSGGAT